MQSAFAETPRLSPRAGTWSDLQAHDPSIAFGNASVNIVDFIDEDEIATVFTRAEIHLGGGAAIDDVLAIPVPEPAVPLPLVWGALAVAALRRGRSVRRLESPA